MQIWARKAYLTISFQLPEQTEKFVMGLFKEQHAFIGDKISGIEMEVESIEAIKTDIPNTDTIKLKSLSSIVLGVDVEGEKNEQYVSPLHPEYKALFLKNLVDKYRATGKENFGIEDMDFELAKLYTKTSMQTIKAGTPAQTKVRGYYFEFELTAPKEMIEVGLNAGFGSMCSLGFGFCEVIEKG
jgi:CRISPR-associated endoribonuclease Cas6